LRTRGYHVCDGLLGDQVCTSMRQEAIAMYENDKFVQSYSEVAETKERIWRKNVYAAEFDGDSWMMAPRLIIYTAEMMQSLPALLKHDFPQLHLNPGSHGHKLAVSTGAGSKYPKHLDNSVVHAMDNRKLTAIYYMNPGWSEDNGGALRIFHASSDETPYEDIAPTGDRLVLFWSDTIAHEVMPCWNEDPAAHRYTFTMWLTSDNPSQIANANDKFYKLREEQFPHFDRAAVHDTLK